MGNVIVKGCREGKEITNAEGGQGLDWEDMAKKAQTDLAA